MSFEVKIPQVGESITEVTIGQWLKADGDYIEMDEVLCEMESEKATLEVRSEKSGVLKILQQEGETVSVGQTVAEIDTSASRLESEVTAQEKDELTNSKTAPTESKSAAGQKGDVEEEKQLKISPVAAKLLEESDISFEQVKATGSGGRVTKSDVEKAIDMLAAAEDRTKVSATSVKESTVIATETEPKDIITVSTLPTDGRPERREKMSTLRKTIARRLVTAKNETAMLTTFNEVDMNAIITVRNKYKEAFQEKYGIKLGFMSFFIKACCITLQEFPEVNAMVEEDEIVFHDFCDISMAVSTPKGLVVPVIFNAERLNLAQIESEVNRLASKARDNKLTIEEMTGGTFSITNGGVFGSLLSTPIINVPQTAILGMHKIEERPIALNGEVIIRPMMYVALSYDHRIIDGKESVNFLVRVKGLLEDPARMLLDV
jgi:2-oxoglutarate dehydrogenase E2 component (dihydrolipoamide succinyltransferase)